MLQFYKFNIWLNKINTLIINQFYISFKIP